MFCFTFLFCFLQTSWADSIDLGQYLPHLKMKICPIDLLDDNDSIPYIITLYQGCPATAAREGCVECCHGRAVHKAYQDGLAFGKQTLGHWGKPQAFSTENNRLRTGWNC